MVFSIDIEILFRIEWKRIRRVSQNRLLHFFPPLVHQDSGVSQRFSPVVVHYPDPNQNTFHELKKKYDHGGGYLLIIAGGSL